MRRGEEEEEEQGAWKRKRRKDDKSRKSDDHKNSKLGKIWMTKIKGCAEKGLVINYDKNRWRKNVRIKNKNMGRVGYSV